MQKSINQKKKEKIKAIMEDTRTSCEDYGRCNCTEDCVSGYRIPKEDSSTNGSSRFR